MNKPSKEVNGIPYTVHSVWGGKHRVKLHPEPGTDRGKLSVARKKAMGLLDTVVSVVVAGEEGDFRQPGGGNVS